MKRVNHEEQWTDVRMSRLVAGVPRSNAVEIRASAAKQAAYVDYLAPRPQRARERINSWPSIAAAVYMDEASVRVARKDDALVRSLIRKVGGRYYVLTKDLIELDVALHSRRVEGKRAGATKKARAGRGRFASRHQTSRPA